MGNHSIIFPKKSWRFREDKEMESVESYDDLHPKGIGLSVGLPELQRHSLSLRRTVGKERERDFRVLIHCMVNAI